MKRMVVVLLVLFAISIGAQKADALVGYFQETTDIVATKAKEEPGIPEWKACLVTPPKKAPGSDLWVFVFEAETVPTEKPDCHQAWFNEFGGVTIYVDGVYYIEDAEKRVDLDAATVATTTNLFTRKEGQRMLSGDFCYDRGAVYGTYVLQEPNFIGHYSSNYPTTPICVQSVAPLSKKDCGKSGGSFLTFTIGESPVCARPGELREGRESIDIRVVSKGDEFFLKTHRDSFLITDPRIQHAMEEALDADIKFRKTVLYIPGSKTNNIRELYPMDYRKTPKVEKVFVGNEWVAIMHYALPSNTIFEGAHLKYRFFVYGGKKNSPHSIHEATGICGIFMDFEKSWELENICPIRAIREPRTRDGKIFSEKNHLSVCIIDNEYFQSGKIHGISDTTCWGALFGPYLSK